MSVPIQAHWAINSTRYRRIFDKNGDHDLIPLPFGKSFKRNGYRVHVVEPSHPFMIPGECRVERPKWHNRVHVARVRWIAVKETNKRLEYKYDVPLSPSDLVTLEYGQGYCGQTLNNPIYIDEPVAPCDCGRADGRTMCPRCDAVLQVHVRERGRLAHLPG